MLLGILTAGCREEPQAPPQAHGIIISTHGVGEDWGTPGMVSAMEAVRAVGANWVSIHRYASIGNGGSVRTILDQPASPDSLPDYLAVPLKASRDLGLQLQIKPHLAYWGSRFSWRGEITFTTEAEWARFFEQYQAWIVGLARGTQHADAFVVGTELDLTLHREAEWRRIIAAVREVTDLPLTYAANWTHYAEVPFWDALDQVGIQAYFPVCDSTAVTPELLDAGWNRILESLRAYSASTGKHIVFTELGYNRAHDTWT